MEERTRNFSEIQFGMAKSKKCKPMKEYRKESKQFYAIENCGLKGSNSTASYAKKRHLQ